MHHVVLHAAETRFYCSAVACNSKLNHSKGQRACLRTAKQKFTDYAMSPVSGAAPAMGQEVHVLMHNSRQWWYMQ